MKLNLTQPTIAICFIVGLGIASTSKILNGDYAFFNSLWPALVGICVITFPLIQYHAKVHAAKIDANIYPTHWSAWLLRAGVTLALACLLHAFYFDEWKIIDLCLFTAGWIGIVFNFSLNSYRTPPMPAFYVGARDKKKDGMIEKIFRRGKYGGLLLFVLEVVWMGLWGWVYVSGFWKN